MLTDCCVYCGQADVQLLQTATKDDRGDYQPAHTVHVGIGSSVSLKRFSAMLVAREGCIEFRWCSPGFNTWKRLFVGKYHSTIR